MKTKNCHLHIITANNKPDLDIGFGLANSFRNSYKYSLPAEMERMQAGIKAVKEQLKNYKKNAKQAGGIRELQQILAVWDQLNDAVNKEHIASVKVENTKNFKLSNLKSSNDKHYIIAIGEEGQDFLEKNKDVKNDNIFTLWIGEKYVAGLEKLINKVNIIALPKYARVSKKSDVIEEILNNFDNSKNKILDKKLKFSDKMIKNIEQEQENFLMSLYYGNEPALATNFIFFNRFPTKFDIEKKETYNDEDVMVVALDGMNSKDVSKLSKAIVRISDEDQTVLVLGSKDNKINDIFSQKLKEENVVCKILPNNIENLKDCLQKINNCAGKIYVSESNLSYAEKASKVLNIGSKQVFVIATDDINNINSRRLAKLYENGIVSIAKLLKSGRFNEYVSKGDKPTESIIAIAVQNSVYKKEIMMFGMLRKGLSEILGVSSERAAMLPGYSKTKEENSNKNPTPDSDPFEKRFKDIIK